MFDFLIGENLLVTFVNIFGFTVIIDFMSNFAYCLKIR